LGLANVLTEARDAVTKVPALYSQQGTAVVGEEQLLLQDSFGVIPSDDANTWSRWIKTIVTTGSASVTGAALTLSSGTGAGGAATYESREQFPHAGGQTTLLRGIFRFGTDGIAGNKREFGLFGDVNNYIVFVLDETQFFCRVFSGGVQQAPDIVISKVNADDNTFMDLELRVTKTEARFLVNTAEGALEVGHFNSVGTQSPLTQAANYKLWMKTINNGSVVANTIIVDDVSLTRVHHGWKDGPNRDIEIISLTNQNVMTGIGELIGFVVGRDNGQGWRLVGNGNSLYEKSGSLHAGLFVPLNVIIRDSLVFSHISGATADYLYVLCRT